MDATISEPRSTLRELAHSLDCLVPSDLQTLTGWSESTLEAYRKRGKGPAFIKTGKHYLYPRSGIAEYLANNTRKRGTTAKDLL